MKRGSEANCRSSAGYTLLELLVVIAIMALVAGLAFPFVAGRGSDTVRLGAAAHTVTGAVRATRAAAILRDTQAVLVIDADKRTLSSPALSEQTLASDIAIQMKFADAERISPARGGIRFYPDGTSTGGEIQLSLHSREARICVNWLTGEPRLGSDC